jgi:hypothetical protein
MTKQPKFVPLYEIQVTPKINIKEYVEKCKNDPLFFELVIKVNHLMKSLDFKES